MPSQRVESEASANDPQLRPSGPVTAPAFDPTDMIADIFDATQELLMDSVPDPRKVAQTLLDLAHEKLPADAVLVHIGPHKTGTTRPRLPSFR